MSLALHYWMGDIHHCSGLSSPKWPIATVELSTYLSLQITLIIFLRLPWSTASRGLTTNHSYPSQPPSMSDSFQKRTSLIEFSASLSLLLSLEFTLIISLRLPQSIASLDWFYVQIILVLVHNLFLCFPEPIYLLTYLFAWLAQPPSNTFSPNHRPLSFLKTCPNHRSLFPWTIYCMFYMLLRAW